ncbi:MAG: ABC transporter substrate-binding protein [Candidatus Kerfeldbacteria bacterium]|nr:ABC transporter substrate-binding protein [Candidatus Kerfeldbacteria bacterium]
MYTRILSLAPSNTEILFALGAKDRLIGITNLCDYPQDTSLYPRIGNWIHENDPAGLSVLEPDLILTSMSIPTVVQEWANTHNIELVNYVPQTLENVYESIFEIGQLIDTVEESHHVVHEMRQEIVLIEEYAAKLGRRPRVYTEEHNNPPTVSANWIPNLVQIAGGIPMAKPGISSYVVTPEQVAEFDPDIIILHWSGFGEQSQIDEITHRKGWEHVRAVREKKIFTIHGSLLNRPGPRLAHGVKRAHELIAAHSEK